MHNLGLFVIQKNKKTMIKEKGKEICQRALDTNIVTTGFDFFQFLNNNDIKSFIAIISLS